MSTDVDIHDDFRAQRKADRWPIEIIRHHCEHGHLCRTTESESTTLQYVFPEGNIATMHNQVANEPW